MMDICNIALWIISTALILVGVVVMLLVFKSRGMNLSEGIGAAYGDGKLDLVWTVVPFILIVLLVVAVILNNRC